MRFARDAGLKTRCNSNSFPACRTRFSHRTSVIELSSQDWEPLGRAHGPAFSAFDNELFFARMSPDVCYLHIGKTAGTYVKSIAKNQAAVVSGSVRLCSHNETLNSTSKDFPGRKIAFTFRDPADRFCSAFDSRLRNGRPTYSSIWSSEEAITFGVFRTATKLAEALDSSDDYLRSAAEFGMQSISHLRRGYSYHSTHSTR